MAAENSAGRVRNFRMPAPNARFINQRRCHSDWYSDFISS
jgi:hypothetical protein